MLGNDVGACAGGKLGDDHRGGRGLSKSSGIDTESCGVRRIDLGSRESSNRCKGAIKATRISMDRYGSSESRIGTRDTWCYPIIEVFTSHLAYCTDLCVEDKIKKSFCRSQGG